MPGLDGLRALAVGSVLLYHGGISWMSGGFLGVEVFFVISGYLITALLLAEWRDTDRIDLGQFWIRRARRLLPALFALLVVVSIVAVIFLPDEVASLRGDVAASFLYVANWGFIFGQKSYFELAGRPSMVQHLWSLAVEEQFYLIWPLLFVGGMKVFGKKHFPIVIVSLAFASAVLMFVLFTPGTDPSRVYYGTDTRAAGLLFGCALAFAWAPWRLRADIAPKAARSLDIAGAVSVAILVVLLYATNQRSDFLYRGGLLFLDFVTLVIIAVTVHPAARLGKVLGIRPLQWVGQRSYGLYLWHWPIFQLTRPGLDVDMDGFDLFAFRMALTFIVAEVSYRFLEMPVRRGIIGEKWNEYRESRGERRVQLKKRWTVGFGALAATLLVTLIAMGAASKPCDINYEAIAEGLDECASAEQVMEAIAARPTTTVPVTEPTASTAPGPTVPGETTTSTAPQAPPLAVPEGVTLTALGDSVMLGAKAGIEGLGPGVVLVDADKNRQVAVGIQLMRDHVAGGTLGNTVLFGFGNNGTFRAEQFDEVMEVAAGRHVIFVNNRVPRDYMDPNNAVIAAGVARHPNATMIDWRTISDKAEVDGVPVFYTDGTHLRQDGSALYVRLVVDNLKPLPPETPGLPPPTTAPPAAEPPPDQAAATP